MWDFLSTIFNVIRVGCIYFSMFLLVSGIAISFGVGLTLTIASIFGKIKNETPLPAKDVRLFMFKQ